MKSNKSHHSSKPVIPKTRNWLTFFNPLRLKDCRTQSFDRFQLYLPISKGPPNAISRWLCYTIIKKQISGVNILKLSTHSSVSELFSWPRLFLLKNCLKSDMMLQNKKTWSFSPPRKLLLRWRKRKIQTSFHSTLIFLFY